MVFQCGRLFSLILSDRFGPVVEKVGLYLLEKNEVPLIHIKRDTELPLAKVKQALCVLVKHQLVTFTPNLNQNLANYTLHVDRIILMLRHPEYIQLIKNKFGDESEMMVEELLQRGYWTASEVILRVIERFKRDHNKSLTILRLREKFTSLVTAQYFTRLTYSVEEKAVPVLHLLEDEKFNPPSIDIKQISLVQSGNAKLDDLPDCGVYWTVNFDRFHQDMRDILIVNNFKNKFGEDIAEFVRLLLQRMYVRTQPWAETSHPIAISDIRDIVRKQGTNQHLLSNFDHYVSVLEQDSHNLIIKTDEVGGGSLQICFKEIFTYFAWETVEEIVLNKFGPKSARIFRLVKTKSYITVDQIQEFTMISAKETRYLTYQLVEAHFLEVREIKRPGGTGPNRSFMLFFAELCPIVKMVIEVCYKTIFNIMTRKNDEKLKNHSIIDKKQKVDTVIMTMRAQGAAEEQLADIEEMITPVEKEILKDIDLKMKKLNTVDCEQDENIFLLQMYLTYQ